MSWVDFDTRFTVDLDSFERISKAKHMRNEFGFSSADILHDLLCISFDASRYNYFITVSHLLSLHEVHPTHVRCPPHNKHQTDLNLLGNLIRCCCKIHRPTSSHHHTSLEHHSSVTSNVQCQIHETKKKFVDFSRKYISKRFASIVIFIFLVSSSQWLTCVNRIRSSQCSFCLFGRFKEEAEEKS